jgi:excisionase family DNA binding protein
MIAPEVMTSDECAEYLRLTPGALRSMRYRGEGPRFVQLGQRVRYRRADVDAWLAANLVKTRR